MTNVIFSSRKPYDYDKPTGTLTQWVRDIRGLGVSGEKYRSRYEDGFVIYEVLA